MKRFNTLLSATVLFFAVLAVARASLTVTVDDSKSTDTKAIVKLTMTNTYTNAVESARAAVFLLDKTDKVVGQVTEWVIGGTADRPALAPKATATYHVVVPARKDFVRTKVLFTRIVLEGGQVIEAGKGFALDPGNAPTK